ncbi:MAG TPA: sugar phosphate isomerase/epimerase [Chloroflexota bacterium]|nr:sugar phosphate isomerase/epimerase [Chloroflexota bacterium]
MDRAQLGLQLYTVRSLTARDMLGTLRQVAQLGFGAVEFAGLGDTPVPVLRQTLDELHLRALGAHVQYSAFVAGVQKVCEDLRTLGCEYAIVPALPQEMRTDVRTATELPARLEEWGKACQQSDLRFAYHNHAFEFAALDGRGGTLFDALLSTDPALVDLELDVFWAEYAGQDALALINQHRDRIALLHLKDIAADQDPQDVPVGRGTLDWGAILAAGKAADVRWFVVEQDNPRDPLDDVTQSLRYLERYTSPA